MYKNKKKTHPSLQRIADAFAAQMKALGVSKYRLCLNGEINRPTLNRILNADGGTSSSTLAEYLETVGLELVAVKKEEQHDNA